MTSDEGGANDGWFVRETVARATEGNDREAALHALDLAVSGLMAGRLTPELSFYLACAFDKVLRERDNLSGDTFIRAFNLRRPSHRPSDQRTFSRDFDIAVWVHLAEKRGVPIAEAKQQASALFALENIDRSLRLAGTVRDVNEGACEEHFAMEGKPLPPRQ